jgi:hypothetical protein
MKPNPPVTSTVSFPDASKALKNMQIARSTTNAWAQLR